MLIPGAKAPKLVTNDMVSRMRPGSVLVDIAVDQGGCFEDTRPTTHADPTFPVHGSIFYCVANMPGAVPEHVDVGADERDAPLHPADRAARVEGRAASGCRARGRLNTVGGTVVNPGVATAHGLELAPLRGRARSDATCSAIARRAALGDPDRRRQVGQMPPSIERV